MTNGNKLHEHPYNVTNIEIMATMICKDENKEQFNFVDAASKQIRKNRK